LWEIEKHDFGLALDGIKFFKNSKKEKRQAILEICISMDITGDSYTLYG
jgi:hypothetical protein